MEFPSFFYLSAPTSPFGYSTPGTTADKTNQDNEYKLPARVNSFSTIAFSDELFSSGKLLPLKLPPRLQTSVPTSPTRSLSSRVRNPFAQRCTWNDSFDPFVIALEKVSEETEGRMSVHRRSHSYSPSISCTIDWDHDQEKEPMITEMMDRKGSMYSKLVRSQAMEKSSTPRTTMKRLWLGRRVRDAEPASVQ